MLRSVQIDSFRALRQLRLDGLSRVNLLNGTGKTTELEAIFLLLAAHNPEVSIRLNVLRGADAFTSEADETWGWLFHDKDSATPVSLEAQDDGVIAKLVLSLTPAAEILRQVDAARRPGQARASASPSTASMPSELVFEFSRNGLHMRTSALHAGDRVDLAGSAALAFPASFFLSTHQRNSDEDARRFAKLEEQGRDSEVVAVLRILEPRLKRLSIYTTGGHAALRADIGAGRLVPVAFMGEGFARTVAVALAVLSAPGGVVLIDEFENGLHYSALQPLWAALSEAANGANAQVVATTHNRECVVAADAAARERLSYDLSVYRLERAGDDVRVIAFTQQTLATALDAGWEIR